MYNYHWSGQFACGADGCQFGQVTTVRSVIKNHLLLAHPAPSSTSFTCNIDECGKTFGRKDHFEAHQRMHRGIKPYQCRWEGCGYASEHRSNAIQHIREKHFQLPRTLKKQQREQGIEDDRDPRQYLHVDKGLLAQSKNQSSV